MKPIQMTDKIQNKIIKDFAKALKEAKQIGDKFSYIREMKDFLTIKTKSKKAYLLFKAEAYLKMQYLTASNTDEVGWHGIVNRISQNKFVVTDILVYPQFVTGATITPDAEEYAKWTMELEDDTFNKMRFHGHSHVNMGVSPSGVDAQYREDMLVNLSAEDFYIFEIINKAGARHIEIYDKANNICYENDDISVDILLQGNTSLAKWTNEQNEYVKKRVTHAPIYRAPAEKKASETNGTRAAEPGEIAGIGEEKVWDTEMHCYVIKTKYTGNKFVTGAHLNTMKEDKAIAKVKL